MAKHRTGNVEAAKKLGYFYNNGWSKAEDATDADQVLDDAAPQLATAQRPKLQLKEKQPANAAAGPTIKKEEEPRSRGAT
ncbi:hypothetical protein ASC94_23320 [Massilia sp. Root418]|nr:hypothetical protein ASC94_23320 [Massilia sp. Root418]